MVSLVIWTVSMGLALASLIVTAAVDAHGLHAAIASLVALALVGMAVRENQRVIATDTDVKDLAISNTRYMGAIWAFSAVTICATYSNVLHWSSWQVFVLGLSGIAVLCLCSANLMSADAGASDARPSLRLARLMSIVQLAGAGLSLAAFWHSGKIFNQGADWAANNVLLFTALSIAILSIIALRSYADFLDEGDFGQPRSVAAA